MKLTFEAGVDDQPKRVQMRFDNEYDLAEIRRWRSRRGGAPTRAARLQPLGRAAQCRTPPPSGHCRTDPDAA